MKRLFLLLPGLLVFIQCIAQNGEFATYNNGFIYSDQAMFRLKKTFDSLNLVFPSCEFNRTYYSEEQSIGTFFSLYAESSSYDLLEIEKELKKQVNPADLSAKYPLIKFKKDQCVISFEAENYKGEKYYSYKAMSLFGNAGTLTFDEQPKQHSKLKGKWLYKIEYSNSNKIYNIRAFYFTQEFKKVLIPKKYRDWIDYADCLIDTTTTKFTNPQRGNLILLPENWQKLSKKEKETLLTEMRETQVWGQCSMDNSPRVHAQNIALLAAETDNWKVFLKAHLDILNDRFDRISDGSYAWAGRETYIGELEALNINVKELLLGTMFRLSNPSNNHYFSNVPRVSRALMESKDFAIIEAEILRIIQDEDLDIFNRIVFHNLYYGLIQQETNEIIKAEKQNMLHKAIEKFPVKILSE